MFLFVSQCKYNYFCQMKKLDSNGSRVFNIGYHIIFCTKFRRRVLSDGVDSRLKELVIEKEKQYNFSVETIEVMPDHVHIFIKSDPTFSPHSIIGKLKGFSARFLRKEFPKLRSRIPCLWTRSYYCESIGSVSAEAITRYIDNQKNK